MERAITDGREQGDRTDIAPMILPITNSLNLQKVESSCPGDRPILACDFYVDGAELGAREAGGLRLNARTLNVDHHAPITSFYRRDVTSTSLAHEHVERVGVEKTRGGWVAINHTDCDSVLSSAVLMGLVPPATMLVDASIAADHTGAPNDAADLLQGLDEGRRGRRTEDQYFESLRNLRLLLQGKALEPAARQALELRRFRRTLATQLVESGALVPEDGLAWAKLEQEIDGALLPSLLPGASVILLFTRHPEYPERWAAKLRLGLAAPAGLTLHALRMAQGDAAFGGRWNAGSNKRGGGTELTPESYAAMVRERLRLAL